MNDRTVHRWQTGGASVIGAAHKRRNMPNQDAWIALAEGETDNQFLIAVADGHGGTPYFRSDVGALLAIEALRELLEWSVDDRAQEQAIKQDLVTLWRRLVKEHVAQHPYSQSPVGGFFEPYGTTLVAVAGGADFSILLQIGDGDLVLGYPDGTVSRPFPGDRLLGEQTFSLCMDEAPAYIKYRVFEKTDVLPDFALVATDGVSKSFVDDTTFLEVVARYRELVASAAELRATLAALPQWLADVSENGSGDDATLCLASRRFAPE